jgi:cytochrome b561
MINLEKGMQWRNDASRYGVISVVLHWLCAVVIITMFASGLWIVGLDYYSPWYQTAPVWHKAAGLALAVVMCCRWLWLQYSRPPALLPSPLNPLVRSVHRVMYGLVFAIVLSGYLISTADGRAVDVCGWFSLPALPWSFNNQEDIAGQAHEYLAWGLITLALLHLIAALKHHVIDRDRSLLRMLGR